MSLQKKIVLVFLILGLGFAFGSYVGLRSVIFPTFQDFELESANQDLTLVQRALDTELRTLDVFNREYSEWDHAYDFALGRRDEYVEENMDTEWWTSVNIHMMLYIDRDGQMLWGAIVDPTSAKEVPIEQELLGAITVGHPLLRNPRDPDRVLGIMQARSAPMLVSSLPILTTAREGAPAGTLITGRYLDNALLESMAENAGVVLALYSTGDVGLSPLMRNELERAAKFDDATFWQNKDEQVIGHKIYSDVFGTPSFIFEVIMPRTITSIGKSSINTTMLFLLAATVAFLLGAWLFIRHMIVAPVAKLTQHMSGIRETGDLDQRIALNRSDEIGQLAEEFGALTTKLSSVKSELETARDDALALAKAKSEFLARMSHEIRTPMNGVLGMVELLNSTPLDNTQKNYALTIHESADSLLDIINDVLDFSKIEAGKLRLENLVFDLHAFLTDTVESLASLADQKGLRLDCIVPEGPALAVHGDPFRLRQVLVNLIGNAIKFTEKGSVQLRVTAIDDDADHMNFYFEVADTGVGIARENQQVIFDSFSQEDGTTSRRFGGTGLGLAISLQLVEMMGGQICVESESGQGSVFSFTLRLKASRESEFSTSARSLQKGIFKLKDKSAAVGLLRGRVLLAEDNAVNQAVAVGMLAAMDVEVVVAKDGNETLERLLCESFDAVLMDCQMPELDGYQATQAIRQLESKSGEKPVPIIAITANALSGDREKCLSAGMNTYLSKPFTGEQLYTALSKYLDRVETSPLQVVKDHMAEESDAPDSQPARQPIDPSVLDALFELQQAGSPDLVKEVVQAYLESSRELATKLHAAIELADAEGVVASAHTLKSSSANVGALKLADLCKTLETAVREGDLSAAPEHQQHVQREFERVIEALTLRMETAVA
ncbi:MAG: ATP-binding protein [Gammaproteobacteria bacterium]|nr:ATP-binding protein [Gammaproteobacteria bacterium]